MPTLPLTSDTPRFQRSRCAGCPLSTRPKNSKFASTNGLLRYAADPAMYWAESHAFQLSRGVVGTIAAKPLKKDGSDTITLIDRSTPCGLAHAIQSNPGISFERSASANLL